MRICSILVSGFLAAAAALAKEPIPTPADVPVIGEVEPWLFKHILESEDRECSLASIANREDFKQLVEKHGLHLFSGPMVGCLSPHGARIWLRTAREADVAIRVLEGDKEVAIEKTRTRPERDLTALIDLKGLRPFTEYSYQVTINGEPQNLPHPLVFRTAPAEGQKATFNIAFGGGARYNHKHERIWNTIADTTPLAVLHLGDNLYIDDPENRKRHNVYYYRRHLRPEFRRMISGSANYAIWDDHDFGKNDCAGGPEKFQPAWKLPVWKVFRNNWVNPGYGGGETQPGCWYSFSLGEVDFFMTDGRYYRDYKKGKTMLGPVQKAWLLDALSKAKGTFKVIASGTLWTETADKGGKDSWWGVKEEREEIFAHLEKNKIGGVILISADRHRCDIYKMDRDVGYPLYEFESSKLTNNHTHKTKDEALFSYNKGNFFGQIVFDLEKDDPTLTFNCVAIDGETVHSFPVKRSQLGGKP